MPASRPVSAATIVEKPRRTSFFSRAKIDSLQDPEKPEDEEIQTDVKPKEPELAPASFFALFRFVLLLHLQCYSVSSIQLCNEVRNLLRYNRSDMRSSNRCSATLDDPPLRRLDSRLRRIRYSTQQYSSRRSWCTRSTSCSCSWF